MNDNRIKREELQRIFGKGSMFQKSRSEEYIESLPKIKGFKRFVKEKKFTSKEINRLTQRMNYHHLKHKSEGGATTLENGAVVSELEHRYMHDLPRPQEEIINNHIREWKVDYLMLTTEGVQDIGEATQETETIEIPVRTTYKSLKQLEAIKRRQEERMYNKLRKEYEDR